MQYNGSDASERKDRMMKHKLMKRISACAAMLLVLISCLAFHAFADEVSGQAAVVHGLYRHPTTNQIEDSGGESSEALGQSMVTSMVDSQGLLETDAQGNQYLSVRLHLMSNVSKVELLVQDAGQGEWAQASWESTGKGDDSEDFRIAVPGKDAVIRARCFVDAMGRDVIFFITADQFTAGNPGGFATLQAGEKTPADTFVQNSSAIPENTVGLVTGGSGKGNSQNTVAGNVQTGEESTIQQVEISASVWVMLFVLVFCAQLLACLAFWGLKTMAERLLERHRQENTSPDSKTDTDSEDAEDEAFDMDFLDSDWEEKV